MSLVDEDGILTLSSYIFAFDSFLRRKLQKLSTLQQGSIDNIIQTIFNMYDEQSIDAVVIEDILTGLLVLSPEEPNIKADYLMNLLYPDLTTIQLHSLETCIESILHLVTALHISTDVDLIDELITRIYTSIDILDNDTISISTFKYCISFVYSYFDMTQNSSLLSTQHIQHENDEQDLNVVDEDNSSIFLEIINSRSILHFTYISASDLVEIFIENSINNVITKDSFLHIMSCLCMLEGGSMQYELNDISSHLFDFFEDENKVFVQDLLQGLLLLTNDVPLNKAQVMFSLLNQENGCITSYELEKLFLHCLRVLICCCDSVSMKLSETHMELDVLAKYAAVRCFKLLELSPLASIDFEAFQQIVETCITLSHTQLLLQYV
jgi:hypothetical protein